LIFLSENLIYTSEEFAKSQIVLNNCLLYSNHGSIHFSEPNQILPGQGS